MKPQNSLTGMPEHLKDDAPFLVCSKCQRKSWSDRINSYCRMPQMNGTVCDGVFTNPVVKK